jgi:hypothetical protein
MSTSPESRSVSAIAWHISGRGTLRKSVLHARTVHLEIPFSPQPPAVFLLVRFLDPVPPIRVIEFGGHPFRAPRFVDPVKWRWIEFHRVVLCSFRSNLLTQNQLQVRFDKADRLFRAESITIS